MRPVVPFARVLDETLAGSSATADVAPPRTYRAPQVIGFFDFTSPGRQPHSPRPTIPSPLRPTRVQRCLTAKQRVALATLVALGATLGADFTIAELRTAFRALARRYHPDSFAGASELERSRLARLFTSARDAYELLRASATPA